MVVPAEPRARLALYLDAELRPTLAARLVEGGWPQHYVHHDSSLSLPSGRAVPIALTVGPVNVSPTDPGFRARTACVIVDIVTPGVDVEDRRAAWLELRELPALVEYVTVAVDRPCVVVLSRAEAGWTRAVHTSGTALLPRYGTPLRLREVYR